MTQPDSHCVSCLSRMVSARGQFCLPCLWNPYCSSKIQKRIIIRRRPLESQAGNEMTLHNLNDIELQDVHDERRSLRHPGRRFASSVSAPSAEDGIIAGADDIAPENSDIGVAAVALPSVTDGTIANVDTIVSGTLAPIT